MLDEGRRRTDGEATRQARVRLTVARRRRLGRPRTGDGAQRGRGTAHAHGHARAHQRALGGAGKATTKRATPGGHARRAPGAAHRPARRGLAAMQYIARIDHGPRTRPPAAGDRGRGGLPRRREQQLRRMARRAAEQAMERGRTVELEPMPANERRIIHLELREHTPGVPPRASAWAAHAR